MRPLDPVSAIENTLASRREAILSAMLTYLYKEYPSRNIPYKSKEKYKIQFAKAVEELGIERFELAQVVDDKLISPEEYGGDFFLSITDFIKVIIILHKYKQAEKYLTQPEEGYDDNEEEEELHHKKKKNRQKSTHKRSVFVRGLRKEVLGVTLIKPEHIQIAEEWLMGRNNNTSPEEVQTALAALEP